MDYQILNLLFRCSKEFSHRRIRMKDLSDTECLICSYVYSHGGSSQDDAAQALKTDKTTVGKALASLENKGCIVRTQDASDRRVKRITLTDAGKDRVTELVDIHDRWLSEIMTCLSEDEQKQFENYCTRLLAAAEEITGKTEKTNGA